MPLVLVSLLASDRLAQVLTGDGSEIAREACADALQWIVPAAVAHLFIGLAASTFAALDDYRTAALGYAAGSAAGLAYIVTRTDSDGIVAVSRGMAVSAALASLIPLIVLGWRAHRTSMPASAARPAGEPLRHRLALFLAAAAIPLSLQLRYVVSVPFAGRLGEGAVTSFGYAYLAATTLAGITAFSIGLVSSVPLSRIELTPAAVSSSRRGRRVGRAGDRRSRRRRACARGRRARGGVPRSRLRRRRGRRSGSSDRRLLRLDGGRRRRERHVPARVRHDRLRALPWIGVAALVVQLPLAWIGVELFGLDGLAFSLALSTLLVLAALLTQLGAAGRGLRGIALAAAVIARSRSWRSARQRLIAGGTAGALLGLALYVALVLAVRPARPQGVVVVPPGASLAPASPSSAT